MLTFDHLWQLLADRRNPACSPTASITHDTEPPSPRMAGV